MKSLPGTGIIIIISSILIISSGSASGITSTRPNRRAVTVINKFIKACLIKDKKKRLTTVLPLIHDSLKNKNLDNFNTRYEQLYSAACKKIHRFKYPAVIKKVYRGKPVTIDNKKGHIDKYLLEKKKKYLPNNPKPVSIFWQEGKKDPKIIGFSHLW